MDIYTATEVAFKNGYEKGKEDTVEKYRMLMMLSIQEMQKYLEITEEQVKLLYHHNYQVAKSFGIEIKE